MTNKHGGPRPNSGRPKGTTLVRKFHDAQAAYAKIVSSSRLQPIEVMQCNMNHFHGIAQGMLDKIYAVVSKGELDKDDKQLLIKLVSEMHKAREVAQRCAVDMAKYVHAPIAAISPETMMEADPDARTRPTSTGGDHLGDLERRYSRAMTAVENRLKEKQAAE